MLVVAIPAYNEEKFIAKTILGAGKYADSVLVVDDGSSDLTNEISSAMGAEVIVHEVNKGYGGALQTIFKAAAAKENLDYLIIIDADGQHNPAEIPLFIKAFKDCECDIVIGSRFLSAEKNSIPVYRKVGMKVLDTATNIATSKKLPPVSDSQSGFRGYNRKAVETIQPLLSSEGMSAGSEILLHASEAGLQLCEIPINVRYDLDNTSSENPIKHGLMVLSKIIGYISYKKPLWFFGLPGVILCVSAFIGGIFVIAEFHKSGNFHYILACLLIFFMFLGLLLFTSGLILNSIVRLINLRNS